ncbi:MAG TPA: roadblock/LC7 domain-containing protein [Thermoplasmata archaeon]|nr:roadblock/LC7 domain-containing protein [Thermoplasmata archaeon]
MEQTTKRPDIRSELERILDRAMRDMHCMAIVAARLDGLPIASRFATKLDPRVAAAVAATIYGAAEVVSRELSQGTIEQIALQYSHGRVVAVGAGPDAVVIAVYAKEGALGLALLSLTRAAADVAAILEEV